MMVVTAYNNIVNCVHQSEFFYLVCRVCQPLSWHSQQWFGLNGIHRLDIRILPSQCMSDVWSRSGGCQIDLLDHILPRFITNQGEIRVGRSLSAGNISPDFRFGIAELFAKVSDYEC